MSLLPGSPGGCQTTAGRYSSPWLPSFLPGYSKETWHPGFGRFDPSIPKDVLLLLFFNGTEMQNVATCTSEGDIPGELTGSSWNSQPCFSSCFPLVIQAFIFDTALIRQVHLQTAFPYIPPCQDDVTLKTRLARG